MTKYRIKLYSKDKKSLYHFLNFLKRNIRTQNSQLFFNILRKKKAKKKITVLKSPHVNKTAQEQFGYSVHSIEMSCCSWEIKKYILLLKKARNYLFPAVKIKISGKFSGTQKSLKEFLFNPVNVKFYVPSVIYSKQKVKSKFLSQNTCVKSKDLLEKSLSYFNVLDCYGSFK
jgi:ribosomal protein S10